MAIKALCSACVMTGAELLSLGDAKRIMNRVWGGQPCIMETQTVGQVLLMMQEGQPDLSFQPERRASPRQR
jgi:hypothetical protein